MITVDRCLAQLLVETVPVPILRLVASSEYIPSISAYHTEFLRLSYLYLDPVSSPGSMFSVILFTSI